jgi:hypothetical protein
MPATPAQIANDLEAQARYFAKHDDRVERACRDAARMIRQLIANEPVDGHTWSGLHTRLMELTSGTSRYAGTQIDTSMSRGLQCLYELRAQR